ncbi:hypothetical protein IHE45_19G017600 [Dioscorea alata]|uniref:Uncharacterized protein n=2 Tax=Dioscorea alata TaxID=55571 RepID=A0ACB7TWM0_DIOAL|nr:hypothetical protein IHE45_19G017600 [Dioscorea alata]KAH7652438.1 hypothetical protein IHE45_19G017600 [Dioscorea alata]
MHCLELVQGEFLILLTLFTIAELLFLIFFGRRRRRARVILLLFLFFFFVLLPFFFSSFWEAMGWDVGVLKGGFFLVS